MISPVNLCVITAFTRSHLIWHCSHPSSYSNHNYTIPDGWSRTHYPTISETLTEQICPLWWVCGRWFIDLAPTPVLGPGALIRARRGKSDSGALAFQKRVGENEPWRKSEVIIFIISQGSNRGNGDLWGERERCTSCSSSLPIGPYKLQW